jgi:hypothetical protein
LGAEKYVLSQLLAQRFSPTILPNDRRRQRSPGGWIPGQHGLALIGQCDDGDRSGRDLHRPPTGVQHRGQQLERILLHPTVRQVLRADLDFDGGNHALGRVDHYRLRPRGALIDSEDHEVSVSVG